MRNRCTGLGSSRAQLKPLPGRGTDFSKNPFQGGLRSDARSCLGFWSCLYYDVPWPSMVSEWGKWQHSSHFMGIRKKHGETNPCWWIDDQPQHGYIIKDLTRGTIWKNHQVHLCTSRNFHVASLIWEVKIIKCQARCRIWGQLYWLIINYIQLYNH